MAYIPKQLGTARDPSKVAFAVTPNDSTPQPFVGRAIYVGGAGDLTVIMANDSSLTPITFANVNAGMWYPIEALYIMNTNTTATDLVVLQ